MTHHDETQCAGRHCCIHNPSSHHMRGWPMVWRGDKGVMERTCPHGVGHPDPDDALVQRVVRHRQTAETDWKEIAEGLYFSLNNDGVIFNNPLSKIMAESTSRKYERAKGMKMPNSKLTRDAGSAAPSAEKGNEL